jgi:hypothetical protein
MATKKIPEKPTVSEFQKYMPELCSFVDKIHNCEEDVIVTAPVKSGKRKMVEYQSSLDSGANRKVQHFYTTSLNRKDIKEQLKELEEYEVITQTLKNEEDVVKLLKSIKNKSKKYPCVLHCDEIDYGSGVHQNRRQLMSKFYLNINDFRKDGKCKIKFQHYSATAEELLLSETLKSQGVKRLEYKPPETYRGAKWFLDNDLVIDAEPFFAGKDLTKQGRECINEFKKSDKNFSILRLCGKQHENFKLNESAIESLLFKKGIMLKKYNTDNSFDWKNGYKNLLGTGVQYLFVINRTCTRSTEVHFHEHIAFWHDYKSETSVYNTIAQAALRVVHYDDVGHKIKLYSDVDCIKYAAGLIDKEESLKRKFSNRTNLTFKNKIDIEVISKEYADILNSKQKTPSIPTTAGQHKKDIARMILDGSKNSESSLVHVNGPAPEFPESFDELLKKYPELKGKNKHIHMIETDLIECINTLTKKSVFY